jgi:hypothetical protein
MVLRARCSHFWSCSKPTVNQQFAAVRRSLKAERKNTALQATSAMEVAQVAVDTGLIFGSAAVMVGITLVVSATQGLIG